MDELNKIKKVLKVWESQFLNEQGRKPNKADIETAPDNIKEFYSKYTKIKKILSTNETPGYPDKENKVIQKSPGAKPMEEMSNMDKPPQDKNKEPNADEALRSGNEELQSEGCSNTENETDKECEEGGGRGGEQVEVWGSKFNRKSTGSGAGKSIQSGNVKSVEGKPSFLHNLGKRLFEQSLKTDNMNKSLKPGLQPWRKPDTPRRGLSPAWMQPLPRPQAPVSKLGTRPAGTGNLCQDTESPTSFFTDPNDFTDVKPAFFSKTFQRAAMIAKYTGKTATEELEEPVVSKFQSSFRPKQTFLPGHLSKLVSKHRETLSFEEDIEEEADIFDVRQVHEIEDGEEDAKSGSGHSWNMSVAKLISQDEKDEKKRKTLEKKTAKDEKMEKSRVAEINKKDESGKETSNIADMGKIHEEKRELCDTNETTNNNLSISVSLKEGTKRTTRNKKSTPIYPEGISTDKQQPIDDLHEEDEISLNEIKKQSKRAARKPRKPVISDDSDDAVHKSEADKDVNEVDTDQELNRTKGGKKRKKAGSEATGTKATKKRKTNAGTSVDSAGVVEEPGEAIHAPVKKAPARAKKPASNENFIKLNMKVKTYKRKGKHMTGPQYKRMMWKQKMQARSKSYGDACFKCGQTGHWANKCPGAGAAAAANKYEKEQVLDEDFPSLLEAASMARGCTVSRIAKTVSTPSSSTLPTEAANDVGMETTPVVEGDEELEFESGIVRSHREINVAPPPMEPLLKCGDGEMLPATPDLVWKGLKKFGFDSFRHGQEEAVMRILCGLSTLVVISTGGGKSLCYQLPAYLYAQRSPCITLVVSPLVSLMEDQVTGLPHGIRGVCLHTNMTPSQRESVLTQVRSGKAQFLLVSPEAVAGGSMSLISTMGSLPPVAFACIDEAHCLSEWSHNFRPSYLRLCQVLQQKLGVQCFLGLTATATLSTASDVAKHLRISDFKRATVRGSPIPPNLVLSVSSDEEKDQ
ncbi:hypothetical protein DPMN_179817, partial [Dreissena polymorpha]